MIKGNKPKSSLMMLSKSSFVRGQICKKSLYLYKHHPELRDAVSIDQQARFDAGHDAGDLARDLHPGGVLIGFEGIPLATQIAQTQEALSHGASVLYEAAFSYDDVFVKVDILRKISDGWELYEVKASNEVKDYYKKDICSPACKFDPPSASNCDPDSTNTID